MPKVLYSQNAICNTNLVKRPIPKSVRYHYKLQKSKKFSNYVGRLKNKTYVSKTSIQKSPKIKKKKTYSFRIR